jgi:hypothetical protein
VPAGLLDCVVNHESHAADQFLSDRKHQCADLPGSQRVGGNSSGRTIDGSSGLQSVVQRRRGFRLNANYLDAVRIPRSDAANKAASANSNEQRVEMGNLLLELKSHGALAQQRLGLIVGVYRERARFGGPMFAGLESVSVALASHDEFRAIAADTFDFFRRSDSGNKYFCGNAQFHRSECNGCAVIAAGGSDDAGLRDLSQKQVRERTPRLEGTRMLKQFEFENQRDGIEAEIDAVRFDHRRPANVRPDSFFCCGDLVAIDLHVRFGLWTVDDDGRKRQGATTSFSLGLT